MNSWLIKALNVAILVLTTFLWSPNPSYGLKVYWGRHPDKERVVFHFDGDVPEYSLARTGKEELTLTIAPSAVQKETIQVEDFTGAALFDSAEKIEAGFVLRMRTASFGYVSFVLSEQKKVVIDCFRDSLGGRWVPLKPSDPAPKSVSRDLPGSGTESGPAVGSGTKEFSLPDASPEAPAMETNATPPSPESPTAVPSRIDPEAESSASSRSNPNLRSGQNSIRAKARRVGPDEAVVLSGGADQTRGGPESVPPVQERDERADSSSEPGLPPKSRAENNTISNDSETHTDPGYPAKIEQADQALESGEFQRAVDLLEEILKPELPSPLRERALYMHAQGLFNLHHEDLRTHYDLIRSAFQRAMNSFPKSERFPNGLFALGLLNLRVGNEPEAMGFFNLLKERFPEHPDIPEAHYALGEHFQKKDDFSRAVDEFQLVVQNYPKSSVARDAAVNLARGLKELGIFDQAMEVSEYVSRRWPDYYLIDPEFLNVKGSIAMQLGEYDKALDHLWTNYNLVPNAEGADLVLARVGDVYLLMGKKAAARQSYETAVSKFPEEEGGLIAKMRLAEEGIYDTLSGSDIFTDFQGRVRAEPMEVYQEIGRKFPDSPLAAVVRIKMAMWHFWNGEPESSLEEIGNFLEQFPKNDLRPRALDVGQNAFEKLVVDMAQQEKFARAVELWNEHDYLVQVLDTMSSKARLALALSLWRTGLFNDAVALAQPLAAIPLADASEKMMALELLVAMYTEQEEWASLLEQIHKAGDLSFTPEKSAQLEYAKALAHENLEQPEKSNPLWLSLAANQMLRPSQQGYAYFFLARHAQHSRDLRKAQHFARESLSLLLEEREDIGKIKECLDILIEAAEKMQKPFEGIRWATEYMQWISEDAGDWPAIQYRLARLYRLGGDQKAWKEKLHTLLEKRPDSLYAKMASADIRGYDQDQKIRNIH
ncbi:MAG: tetratricopeptide repeat protein [Desulfovibrionales bacterium]